jgi:hypothetical protein
MSRGQKASAAAKKAAKTAKSIVLEGPAVHEVGMEISGLSMIINAFSQKTLEQMLRKHMGLSVDRTPKKPIELIEQAIVYNTADKISVPPVAIKKAMLTASVLDKTFPKTQLRQMLFIHGGSVPITYEKKVNRMDMVRVAMGKPDIRFRPQFDNWKARFIIEYSEKMDLQYVVDTLNRAGRGVGIMEWRPEKDGTFGTFHVSRLIDDPKELAEVRNGCTPMLKCLEIPEWALQVGIEPEMLAKIAGEHAKKANFKESDVMTDEEIAEYNEKEKAKKKASKKGTRSEAKA